MIKHIAIFSILVFICTFGASACARIIYKEGEFSYWRLGSQKIDNLELVKSVDGSLAVKFDKQEGKSGDLSTALKNMTEIMVKMR